MGDTAWKATERRVAAAFNTVRNSLSGGNSKVSRSDSIHPKLFIETKRSTKYKAAISLWDEAKTQAAKKNKTPVVALAAPKRRGFWIVVHVDHLKEVANELKENSE